MLKLCIILLCVAGCALGGPCNFTAFHACMTADAHGEVKSKGPRPQGGERPKNPMSKCLEDAKCNPPTHPPKGGPGGKQAKGGQDKSRECYAKIFVSVKGDVEKCVQKKYKEFKFPEGNKGGWNQQGGGHRGGHGEGPDGGHSGEPSSDGEGGRPKGGRGGGPGAKGRGGGENMLDRWLNSSCPTPQAKASASACIKALPKPANQKNDRVAKICAKKNACIKNLSPECQQKLVDVKKEVCTCGTSVINAQSAKIEADVKACKPQGADASNKGHGFKAAEAIKKLCDDRSDPCKVSPK